MNILPVTPVETLAATVRANNTGVVPPWLTATDVPVTPRPTLPPDRGRNPGIVPPWLQDRPVAPDEPVGPQVPRILGGAAPTIYEPHPINPDPTEPDPHVPRIL